MLVAVFDAVDEAMLLVVLELAPDVVELSESRKGAACFGLPLRLAAPTLSAGQPVGEHAFCEQHPRKGGEDSAQVYQRNPGSRHSCARILS